MPEKEEVLKEGSSKDQGSESIELTYAQVQASSFLDGCHKLAQHSTDLKTAYWIKRIFDKLDQERKTVVAGYRKLLEDNPMPEKPTEEDLEAFGKKQDEFGNTKISVPCRPIDVRKLDGLKLTTAEAAAIEPLLEFPEE